MVGVECVQFMQGLCRFAHGLCKFVHGLCRNCALCVQRFAIFIFHYMSHGSGFRLCKLWRKKAGRTGIEFFISMETEVHSEKISPGFFGVPGDEVKLGQYLRRYKRSYAEPLL